MGTGRKSEGSIPLGVGKGLAVTVILTLLSAGIFAALIRSESLSESITEIWAMTTLGIGSMIGCLIAAKSVGSKYAIVSALTAIAYIFILLSCGILFFDGGLSSVGQNLLAVVLGTGISCVLSLRKSGNRRKQKMFSR